MVGYKKVLRKANLKGHQEPIDVLEFETEMK